MFTVDGSDRSQFSWDLFSFDQWCITSKASCDLLCVDPLSMVSDTVVSSTYFHMSKVLGTDMSLIIKRKSHGASLVPLESSGKKLDDPIDYAIGNIDLFEFANQDSVDDEVEGFPIIEKKDPHS